ncbi:HpcH/HpaI aldolase/citrate lyase family protein [Sporobolomyces salmoneus]|uniref:HpcH/HpaI aldolase/citrate lyase family protein n=1 Tax=Sporobolomyces salmoneus TaxID=183962 RepID=UPI00316D7988
MSSTAQSILIQYTRRVSYSIHPSRTSIPFNLPTSTRFYSAAPTAPLPTVKAQRALLYVPGSNPKHLNKALRGGLGGSRQSQPDVLILDLEDSVRIEKKAEARQIVFEALQRPSDSTSQKFVRINSRRPGLDDLEVLLKTPNLRGLVLPKVDSAKDVLLVNEFIDRYGLAETKDRIRIIASIESPMALLNLREIVTSSPRISSLLFAAEDYCSSSNLIRTPSRREMLFARSSVVTVAKAYGLKAVDLVCVQYKGEKAEQALMEESREGRELGFDGKQAIHPAQVEPIQAAFTPSESEIERALTILSHYESLSSSGAGAYGLANTDGSISMIDAPMLLQAQGILVQARAAGVDV